MVSHSSSALAHKSTPTWAATWASGTRPRPGHPGRAVTRNSHHYHRYTKGTGPSALHLRPFRKPCMCLFHPFAQQEQPLELNMINVPASELKLSGPMAPGLTLNPRKAQHEVRDLPRPGKGLQPTREHRDCQSSTRLSGRIRRIVLSPPRGYI